MFGLTRIGRIFGLFKRKAQFLRLIRLEFAGENRRIGGLSDVWVLSHANGLGGTPAWTKLLPSGGPPSGVAGSSAVYDPTNNIMTVFAGINHAATAATNGAWTLSHANGVGGTPQWTNIVANGAAGSPAKRESPTAVYDVANNRMIIFGGRSFTKQRCVQRCLGSLQRQRIGHTRLDQTEANRRTPGYPLFPHCCLRRDQQPNDGVRGQQRRGGVFRHLGVERR